MLIVGVKYCGNCNPSMDMPGFLRNLSRQASRVRFVHWSSEEVEVLLVLHGCRCACTQLPDFEGKVIEVSCDSIDCWHLPREELLPVLLEKLKNLEKEHE